MRTFVFAIRTFGRIIFVIVICLAILLTILPVIDLPIATSVPGLVWALLALMDVALLIAWFRIERTARGTSAVLLGFVSVAILAVIVSQQFASTPPIAGTNSIAVLEKVKLGGTDQWITIRGKDATKPVLLYLGIGGPGAGGFPASAMNLRTLEDHFVVVNWDQPGTGKSYYSEPISTLKVDKFVADAHELTEILSKRFDQDKIYVMGLSWGTILGTKLVQQYPDNFYAYIGNGQMVNTTENDRMGYQFALKTAADRGDQKLLNKLYSIGEPPYNGDGMALKYAAYNNVLFSYMGSPRLELILLIAPQFAREYGLVDKINFDRGLIESFKVVYPQLEDLDFITQAPKMEVPMYFVVGRKDINAMASLVERYYNVLQAPYKELIWLESGHGATAEEFEDALVNHVLVNSPPNRR